MSPSPLLGYNNNVRHKGRVFHIQTEDSGVKYGRIMTHLFTDGGRILKSVKTSYSEYVGNERMSEIVREMMKQQHKAMFIALRDGKFEAFADGTADGPPSSRTLVAEAPPNQQPSPRPVPTRPTAIPPPLPPAARMQRRELPAATEPEELTLDIDALERAAVAADVHAPSPQTSSELPPAPADLLREKKPSPSIPSPGGPPLPPGRTHSNAIPGAGHERRYAPTRPASIFGQARPQQGKSIFGEDLLTDKSLDEVILSYLAEDLTTEKK
ncbi:MAG: hypothetical protein M3O46_23795 [Myxococcota bacterium]|nr:hypothetical protein [Myxococcota bacterium]